MGRTGLLAVVVAVLAVVSATLVWSAEQAPAPAAPAAPAAAQPAGEQPKAEAAPAPAAPAEGAPAPAAPTGAEAPAAPEKVKGWICEVKWGDGSSAMRSVTLKVAGDKMRAEGPDWGKEKYLVDAGAKATYAVTVRELEDGIKQAAVDKYSWSVMNRTWRTNVDEAVQMQRMRSGITDLSAEEREAAKGLAKALEAQKTPATLEASEETKKFGDYDCVLYNLTQGDKVKAVVWVAKGLKVDAPVWGMVGHTLDLGMGGVPVLAQLDGMEAGFPIRVNLEYIGFRHADMFDRKLNFWIEKVTQADVDVADIQLPRGAQVSESMH
jgi:hypothetical protein